MEKNTSSILFLYHQDERTEGLAPVAHFPQKIENANELVHEWKANLILDLVMVNNLVKEAMDCLIVSNSGEEMRRRALLAVTTCLVSLL